MPEKVYIRKKTGRKKQNFKDEEVRTQGPMSHELSEIGMSYESPVLKNMGSGMEGKTPYISPFYT